tara:strand:+ start:4929 stop:5672 length:744 start_codon:yes stop_codon:yes gene_type:complete
LLDYIYLFLISLISNIFSAFSGGGAGVIQLPAILLLFDIAFINALAVHKIATVALGIGATSKFVTRVAFDIPLIFKFLVIGVPGVIIGANVISLADENYARMLLGILISSIGLYSIFKKGFGEEIIKIKNSQKFLGFILIFISALLNGSLSAGTGLIFTMILISCYGMDYRKAIAYTLIIVGLFYNAVGAITLGLITNINWDILPALFIGSLLGGYIGAKISLSKSNRTIKIVYQIITISVGVSLIY